MYTYTYVYICTHAYIYMYMWHFLVCCSPEPTLFAHSQIYPGSHSRHLCRETRQKCLLRATADIPAA